MSLCGRLWTLTYVYSTVFELRGGWRSVSGRCCGAVGGVGGASTMHVRDALLCAVSVLCDCVCTSQK